MQRTREYNPNQFPTLAASAIVAVWAREDEARVGRALPEGAGGNACASRARKGNAPRSSLLRVFPSHCESNQRLAAGCRAYDLRHSERRTANNVLLTDKFGRSIHDLRISITDRCNYRCVYCRTGTNGAAYAELPFEDYLRMARVLVGLGITKIRLTGGEPLLRKGIIEFVRDLAKLRTVAGDKPEIALTTNGHLLAEIAQPLKDAGLNRVTVSMDAVDPERFARITRVPNGHIHSVRA